MNSGNLEILVTTKKYVKDVESIVTIYGVFGFIQKDNVVKKQNWLDYIITKFF